MVWIWCVCAAVLMAGSLMLGDRYFQKRYEESLQLRWWNYLIECILTFGTVFLFFRYGYAYTKISRFLFLFVSLPVIGKIDRKKEIIPNAYVLGLLIVRSVVLIVECVLYSEAVMALLTSAGFGMLYGSVIFLIVKLIKPQSIGMGDVKLFGVIGFYLGSNSIFAALLISLFIAMGYGLFMVARKRLTLKDSLRFGPFIAIGTRLVLILGA